MTEKNAYGESILAETAGKPPLSGPNQVRSFRYHGKQVRLCCASAGMFRYEADTTVLGAYQGAVFRLYMKETEKSGWNRGNTAPGAGRSGAGGFFTLQERVSCIVPLREERPAAEEKMLRMQPAAGGESGRAGY